MLLALSVSAQAQQPAKIPKLGWLGGRSPGGPGGGGESFRRALRDSGYVEGKTVTIEYRYAEDKLDRLPALAEELVRLNVDLIIAPTTVEVRAAKAATKTIPIVFYNVPDPVGSGLVDSLARPGGNLRALARFNALLSGKRLELLKETIPKLTRVAVLWDPQNPSSAQQWKERQQPARELGLQLHSMEVSSADKYESAFKEAVKARSGALLVTQSTLGAANSQRVHELAVKNRLPAISTRGDYVSTGALMSYGADGIESLPTRCRDGRQDSQRNEARGSTSGAADEIRILDQSQNRQADRPDDPAERVGQSQPSNSIKFQLYAISCRQNFGEK